MNYDYTTFGHVTIDVLEDGTEQAGGGAFYSALQAAALGLRTRIVTRGEAAELERLLAPFAGQLELEVQQAPRSTRQGTRGSGARRRQQMLAWAGPLEPPAEASSEIVHFAPVAQEIPLTWPRGPRFRALTPQGLVRSWDGDGTVRPSTAPGSAVALADSLDAAVINAGERPLCEALLERALAAGAVVSVTDEGHPNTLLYGTGEERVPLVPLADVGHDLGAGDVYAAAFFVSLAGGHRPAAAAARANVAARWHLAAGDPTAMIGAAQWH